MFCSSLLFVLVQNVVIAADLCQPPLCSCLLPTHPPVRPQCIAVHFCRDTQTNKYINKIYIYIECPAIKEREENLRTRHTISKRSERVCRLFLSTACGLTIHVNSSLFHGFCGVWWCQSLYQFSGFVPFEFSKIEKGWEWFFVWQPG